MVNGTRGPQAPALRRATFSTFVEDGMQTYIQLEQHFDRLSHIDHALTVLQWDQEVMMPSGGAGARAETVAELSAMRHARLSDQALAGLLAEAEQGQLDLSPEQQANLREMRRHHQDAAVLPSDLVRALSLATSQCQHAWVRQRRNNDWAQFAPLLSEVVRLVREQARIRQAALGAQAPYDAMLELYNYGDGSDLVREVFGVLKSKIPVLLQQAMVRQEAYCRPIISGPFPVAQQKALSERVMAALGFDFQHGRLDVSAHPFSTGTPGDRRITTRYSEDNFIEALYSTIHETGHARYESGLPMKWCRQPVGQARNMSIHESQSLFFEKQIACGRAFCDFLTPLINSELALPNVLQQNVLHQAVNWAEPGLIRVNADELTYSLHIILRYEIESDLINGVMEVSDIPDVWDEKMQAYLGLTTSGDYQNGCMQDVHWSSGAFGYFPSYTLGAVNAAQFQQAMVRQIGNVDDLLRDGDLGLISEWLREHVWQRASFLSSQALMAEATGQRTCAQSLLSHLSKRYLDV